MNPRRVTSARALFIGGPLDWQLKEVDIKEELTLLLGDGSVTYHRELITDETEEHLLVVYVYEKDVKSGVTFQPRRFEIFLKAWSECVKDPLLRQNSVGMAKGIVDASHDYFTKMQELTKKYRKGGKGGTNRDR